MPKAIQVTRNNINNIIYFADMLEFDLSHLHDSLKDLIAYRDCAAKPEVLYLIMDGHVDTNNVTFTEMIGADFYKIWKFANQYGSPTEFTTINKI